MTQQNQQNPSQQVLWVLLRGSQANLSKIQPGKIKPPDTAALKYWLGNRQPDRWREQQEEAPAEREPLEIHVTVDKPAPEEVPEEYLIEDGGQEGSE